MSGEWISPLNRSTAQPLNRSTAHINGTRKRALVVVALFMKYKTQTTKIPVSSTFQEKTGENITNTDSSIRAYIF